MKTYFLFSDDEVFQREINADTWRGAIAAARDWFQIRGRIRIVDYYGVWGVEGREYRLDGTDYKFDLKKVESGL